MKFLKSTPGKMILGAALGVLIVYSLVMRANPLKVLMEVPKLLTYFFRRFTQK